jgi:hypothetical protein
MTDDVSIGGNGIRFNIKDVMYWWNLNPFGNIWDVVEFESCL